MIILYLCVYVITPVYHEGLIPLCWVCQIFISIYSMYIDYFLLNKGVYMLYKIGHWLIKFSKWDVI